MGTKWLLAVLTTSVSVASAQSPRARARDLGVAPGIFMTGALNAITDVSGVRVGQVTLNEGDKIRTGITAIFPHAGNAYLERVPAAACGRSTRWWRRRTTARSTTFARVP